MPTVPRYDAPEIAKSPLPSYRQQSSAQPIDFESPLARGVGQLAQTASEFLSAAEQRRAKQQKLDDQADVTAAYAELTTAETGYRMAGAQSRVGEAARGYSGDYLAWFDETAQSVGGKLRSNEARAVYAKMVQQARSSGWKEAATHEAMEGKRYSAMANDAALRATIQSGVSAVLPEDMLVALAQGKQFVKAGMAQAGVSQDSEDGKLIYADNLAKYTQAFHTARLQRLMAANNMQGAKEHLEVFGDEMQPEAVMRYNEVLSKWTDKQAVADKVDAVMATMPTSFTAGAATVKEMFPERESYETAMRIYKEQWSIHEAAKEERAAAALAPVNKIIGDALQAGGTRAIDTRKGDVAGMLSILATEDPAGYLRATQAIDAYNDEVRAQAKAAAAAASGGTAAAREDKTGYDVAYVGLYDEYLANPEAFAQKNLLLDKRFMMLNSSDKQEIQKLKGKTSRDDVAEVATLTQQLSGAHAMIDAGGGSKKKRAEAKAKFDRVVRDAMAAEQKAGKKFGYEERQRLIDRMLIEGEVEKKGWNPDVRAFEVYGTPAYDAFVPDRPVKAFELRDVPKIEQDKIKDAAKRSGKVATPQEIIRKYNQKHGF